MTNLVVGFLTSFISTIFAVIYDFYQLGIRLLLSCGAYLHVSRDWQSCSLFLCKSIFPILQFHCGVELLGGVMEQTFSHGLFLCSRESFFDHLCFLIEQSY